MTATMSGPSDWEREVHRMRETYGPGTDIPSATYTNRIGTATPLMPVAGRIAELAQRVTEAGHMLAEARAQYRAAREQQAKCEAGFAQISNDLLQVISEHREGTPEGVPQQP